MSGNTVTIVGAGTTTITASQPGNEDYSAAAQVHQGLLVYKGNQAITFGSLDSKTYGDESFELTATASSGLDVSYSSSDGTVALVGGNTVTMVGVGSATITANQAGNDNFNAATPVDQVLTVDKGDQNITFDPLPTKILSDDPYDLTATVSSGLEVSYTSSDGTVATVEGSTVTILGVGTTTITASQDGNNLYYPAIPVEQTFEVIASSAVQSSTQAAISIYPNPASGHIIIQTTGIIDRVEVLDMNGKLMSIQYQGNLMKISHLEAGIYLLKVYSADAIQVGKFVKY